MTDIGIEELSEAGDVQAAVNFARENNLEISVKGGGHAYAANTGEQDRVPTAYGENYKRLVELKKKWDPDNVFRMNHNIHPSG